MYRTGGSGTTAWFITGTDESATIDWGSLAISGTRAFVYDAELLTVNSNPGGPVITTQPSNVSVTEPAGATFTVVASGDPVLTYQWRRNGANISGATGSSYTLNPTNAAADNGAQFDVVVNNPVGPAVTSAAATLTVQTSGGGGPTTAWTAGAQSSGGSWLDSTFDNRTFRTLLRGSAISASGGTVQLQFRGRTSGSYIINNVSLVQRTGSTLNGDDSTSTPVTFGGSSNITVPPGGLTSDPIAFNLVAGQDVFLTFWVPAGAPGVYRTGGSGTTAWFITGTDESATIDWGSLAISGTRAFVYDAELLTVNSNPGGTGFAAYNDLAWGSGQLNSRITTFTSPNGNSGQSSSGPLVDFATGSSTGVVLTVQGGDFNGTTQAGHGANPGSGTDAHNIFNGIVSGQGALSYQDLAPSAGNLVLTFSNLDSGKTYDIAFYAHRNAHGWDRASLVTLSSVNSFTNQSSVASDNPDTSNYPGGVIFTGPNSPSTRLPADNDNGYVARFTGVNPGSDGVVLLTISWDGTAGLEFLGKYGSAVRLISSN